MALETAGWAIRCYDAPTVELDRSPKVRASVASLGPDLSVPVPDLEEVLVRSRRRDPRTTVTEVLLDQSVVSGIGNVYRNEVLFEMGIHPATPIGEVDDALLDRTLRRCARHLRLNAGRRRTTTGARRAGMNLYVYETSEPALPPVWRHDPEDQNRRAGILLVRLLPGSMSNRWMVSGDRATDPCPPGGHGESPHWCDGRLQKAASKDDVATIYPFLGTLLHVSRSVGDAAVHIQRDAGDPGRPVRAEERNRPGHVDRLTDPSQRVQRGCRILVLPEKP